MGIRKIKITESQYELLLRVIAETPFDKMVKDNIKVGDTVNINWNNKINKFRVINSNNGQIIMDNIDNDNDRVYMGFTSLDDDNLELRKTEKDRNINDIKKWPRVTLKDISDIQIFRGDKLIDTVDPISGTNHQEEPEDEPEIPSDNSDEDEDKPEPDGDFMDKVNHDLAIIMEDLIEGKGLNLEFKNERINFCCVKSSNNYFNLTINTKENDVLKDLNQWDGFILELKGNPNEDNLYLLNKDIVSTSDGVTYNLKFRVYAGVINKEVIIKSIYGVSVLPNCDSPDEVEDTGTYDKNKKKKEKAPNLGKTDEEALADANKALEMILADEDLKNAFYKQPSFWERFKSELTGKKAHGTGILTVTNLVNQYSQNKLNQKIGYGFKVGKPATFLPLEEVSINYRDEKGELQNYTLPMDKDEILVRGHKLEDVSQVLLKKIEGTPLLLRILVKSKTKYPNVKLCDVEIGKKDPKGEWLKGQNPLGEERGVNIKFFDSEGYDTRKDKINTKQRNR